MIKSIIVKFTAYFNDKLTFLKILAEISLQSSPANWVTFPLDSDMVQSLDFNNSKS